MDKSKFGTITVNTKELLSIVAKESIEYESYPILDIKRISQKGISKSEFVIFVRDALLNGYCVLFECNAYKKKCKSMVFSIHTSLIRNFQSSGREGSGYDIKFDFIEFNDNGTCKTQNTNDEELFEKFKSINSGEIILIKENNQ